jgi:hypothetical protein
MIVFINAFFYYYTYNHLQQLTINDCLRLVPFLTGLRVPSTVTDLVLIVESVTSLSFVVRWLPLSTAEHCISEFPYDWLTTTYRLRIN